MTHDGTSLGRAIRPSDTLPRTRVNVRVVDGGAHEQRIREHEQRVEANAGLIRREEAEQRQRSVLRRARMMRRRVTNHYHEED